jgi:hypothetical protein
MNLGVVHYITFLFNIVLHYCYIGTEADEDIHAVHIKLWEQLPSFSHILKQVTKEWVQSFQGDDRQIVNPIGSGSHPLTVAVLDLTPRPNSAPVLLRQEQVATRMKDVPGGTSLPPYCPSPAAQYVS